MSGRIGAVKTAGRGMVSGSLDPSPEAIDTVGRVAILVDSLIADTNDRLMLFKSRIGVKPVEEDVWAANCASPFP